MNKKPLVLALVWAVSLSVLLSVSFGSSQGVVSANVLVVPFGPANVMITNLTTSSSVTVGAQLPLYATLNNTGGMAATNVILNVSVTGPAAFNSVYSIPSLSPLTSENVTIQINGAASVAGSYTLNAFATYLSNSVTYNSNVKSVPFTVTSPGPGPSPSPGGGGGGPPPIKVVPGISITSIPVISSTLAGQGLSSQIVIQNNQSVPETINFTVDKNFTSLLSLSSNSLYLLPGQSGVITITFKTSAATHPGTYVIPLTITVSDPVSQTEYLTFTVYGNLRNGLQIVGQTFLTNSLKTLSGVIAIDNSGNTTIRNGTLTTTLPGSYAYNISQISAFGLPNNVTHGLNGYVITWMVNKLQPGQSVYAYYTAQNQSSVEYLSYPQNIFSTPSPVPSSSVLKIVEISSPSLYSNSAGYVNASVFYTGTKVQQVSFYLAGPAQTTISDPVQVVNASPNQLLRRQFSLSVGNYTGTLLLYLYITSSSANLTEAIPLIVAPLPTTSTTTIQQVSAQVGLQRAVLALEAIAALTIVLIVLLSILKLRRRPPRYSGERARNLIRLRKRIRGEPVD